MFNENRKIYGSRKLSVLLSKESISISDRTLRDYMARWNLVTKTRVSKRKSESKNTSISFKDIVQCNFNPKVDNIIATDVSYISAKTQQNNVYLSVAISHETKLIESWKLSSINDSKLVTIQ